jgi:AcrR family transcriptional regulator
MDSVPDDPKDDATGERIKAAAWALLVDSFGWGDSGSAHRDFKLLEQIKATDVTRKAKLSTGAFYSRWSDRESFVDDMLDFALFSARSAAMHRTLRTVVKEARKGESLGHLITLTTRADLDAISNDPAFAVQMYLWSGCRARPEVRSRLKTLYDEFSISWVNAYQEILDEYGFRVREPFQLRDIDTVFSALVQGLVIQNVIGREIPEELFTWTVLALVLVLARKPSDERSLFDLWESSGLDADATAADVQPDEASLLSEQSPETLLRAKRRRLRAAIDELQELEAEMTMMIDQGSSSLVED